MDGTDYGSSKTPTMQCEIFFFFLCSFIRFLLYFIYTTAQGDVCTGDTDVPQYVELMHLFPFNGNNSQDSQDAEVYFRPKLCGRIFTSPLPRIAMFSFTWTHAFIYVAIAIQ